MLSKFTLITLSICAASVSAHFTLDYPLSRGFDEDIEPNVRAVHNTRNRDTS